VSKDFSDNGLKPGLVARERRVMKEQRAQKTGALR